MDSNEVQLAQAVEIASNAAAVTDTNLVSQALAYLEQLKQATDESWSTGWAVWVARDDGHAKYAHAVRLFGLNLVDDFLERRYVAHNTHAACMPWPTPEKRWPSCKSQRSPTCRLSLLQATANRVWYS